MLTLSINFKNDHLTSLKYHIQGPVIKLKLISIKSKNIHCKIRRKYIFNDDIIYMYVYIYIYIYIFNIAKLLKKTFFECLGS